MQYGPQKIVLTFDGKNLTHFGGIYLLHLFFKRIQLRHLLYRKLTFTQRNNRYSVPEEMLALIYPITLGIGRIEATHLLKQNGVFQYLTGLSYSNHSEINNKNHRFWINTVFQYFNETPDRFPHR